MSTHKLGFCGEIRNIPVFFGWKKKNKKKTPYGDVLHMYKKFNLSHFWNSNCALIEDCYKKLTFNPCHVEYMKMQCPLLIVSQSFCFIKAFDTNSRVKWETVQIQINWLLPEANWSGSTLFAKAGIPRFSRTRVNTYHTLGQFSKWYIDDIFHVFFQKTMSYISCKLSP